MLHGYVINYIYIGWMIIKNTCASNPSKLAFE